MTATLLERARRTTPLGWLARPRLPIAVAILALLTLAAGLLGAAMFERAYDGRILPGVSVAGIDLAGASQAEARARLAGAAVEPVRLTLVVGARTETVPAEELGRQTDLDAAVATAMAAGRGGGFLGDIGPRLALLRDGGDLPMPAVVDDARLTAWISAAAAEIRRDPVSAGVTPTATGWQATLAANGAALDVPAATALVREALVSDSAGVAGTRRIVLPVLVAHPDVDDVEVSVALAAAYRMSSSVGMTLDDKSWTIAAKDLRAAIDFVTFGGRPVPVMSGSGIETAVARLTKKVKVTPRETLFLKTHSGAIFGYVPGTTGRTLDVAATAGAVAELVAERRDGGAEAAESVEAVTIGLGPRVSAGEAAAIAPRMTRISTWTTHFVPSERNGFGNNITIPAHLINGTVVMPGNAFDFWGAVGPVTGARGFRLGGIIQGGHTNPTGAIGGGICSASTTLFNAAVRGGYQILQRSPHFYYITRYPLGLDATVSKSGGASTQNMRFRNDTGTPLYIRGTAGYGWVRFEIYSLPTGRSVSFTRPTVSNVRRAVDHVIRTTALRRGTSRRDETPANGMDVVVFRTVRDARGAVVHQDRFVSHYGRVDGILLVGTGR